MNPRLKKLIAIAVFLPALLIYFGLVVTIADFLPENLLVYLVYYIIAGTAWAFPLKPLMMWMNAPAKNHTPDQ